MTQYEDWPEKINKIKEQYWEGEDVTRCLLDNPPRDTVMSISCPCPKCSPAGRYC